MQSPASTAPQRTRFSWTYFCIACDVLPAGSAMIPGSPAAAVLLVRRGIYVGSSLHRPTRPQGDSYRIIFIHVGAAWMSMFLYVVMAFWAIIVTGMEHRLAAMMSSAIAPPAPCSRSLRYGRARSGASRLGNVWVWNARLTSELILLFCT